VPWIIGSEFDQMPKPIMSIMSCAVLLSSGCKSAGDAGKECVAQRDVASTMAWLFPPLTDEQRTRLLNPPPLELTIPEGIQIQTITADQLPEPVLVPFDDPDHVKAYTAYYKRAYVWAANMPRYSSVTCCLSIGDAGLHRAIVRGHYDGQRAAHQMLRTAEEQD
jgi:hypothetical protein